MPTDMAHLHSHRRWPCMPTSVFSGYMRGSVELPHDLQDVQLATQMPPQTDTCSTIGLNVQIRTSVCSGYMRGSAERPAVAAGIKGKSMNVISARGRLVRNEAYLHSIKHNALMYMHTVHLQSRMPVYS